MNRRLRNRVLILLTDKERSEGRRINQTEIANAIGVAGHTVGSWIRNDVTKIEAKMVERLCDYFKCDVGDLLYLEDVPEGQPAE